MKGGSENVRFPMEKWPYQYLGNGERYGLLIENH